FRIRIRHYHSSSVSGRLWCSCSDQGESVPRLPSDRSGINTRLVHLYGFEGLAIPFVCAWLLPYKIIPNSEQLLLRSEVDADDIGLLGNSNGLQKFRFIV